MLLLSFFLWLAYVAIQVIAGGDVGGLEKMWFYDSYVVAWAWQGKDQKFILRRGKSKTGYNSHWGSATSDGQLSFSEFMEDITNKPRGSCTVLPPDPASGRDVMTVAKELNAAGFGAEVETQIANKVISAAKKSTNSKTGKTLIVSKYVQLIDTLSPMITKARANIGDAKIASQLKEMKGLVELIGPLREAEFYPWMITDLNKFFAEQYELLDAATKELWGSPPTAQEKTVTIDKAGISYQKVDWRATVNEYPWFYNDKARRNALKMYVKNYGDASFVNPDDTAVPDYSGASRSHYQTIDGWAAAQAEGAKGSSECKK